MNISHACAGFLDYCNRERHLSPNSLTAYKQDLAEFLRFSTNRPVADIHGRDLVAYAQHLTDCRRLAPATVKRRLACLRSMFGWLVRRGQLGSTPFGTVALRVRLPVRLPRCLDADDLRSLLCAADKSCPTTRMTALLLFATGVRVSELAAVRIEDVNIEQRSIRIFGKGSRERQVFLPDEAVAASIRDYITAEHGKAASSGPLLTNAHGRPANAACLRMRVTELARKAGISRRVTPHMLRHTAATALIEAGVDIRFVQRLLGHKSIVTTQVYTHVSDIALKAAVTAANVCRSLVSRGAAVMT